ncbi:MAG TPA: glycoside hydrolase family 38 C-terminal domain-containing protein [Oscillospiraceae bacterium]|nr:glycoside hydrolase family 38 C-terminal domain-containing protein [Oscillospiraceae bacterium]HPS35688.1 glycoside hydrolase family 38 C-terminal domain-containing protein [Oscillospiraceae bacterium]
MADKKKCFVISHTHWDREWYETFQGYRFRLVRMFDELLEVLEQNPDYKVFHTDGQTIVLEDYLEIRPENRDRMQKLIDAGKLIIGPWYVMPDEFLISGESLVRNLQKGNDICKEYNAEPMKTGYVIDIFGHNAQFPQLLKGFGFESAVVYRGIGDFPKDAFTWIGADGSEITAFKLDIDRTYSNFYFSIRWPFEGREYENNELFERTRAMLDRSDKAATCSSYLMMDGCDHIDTEPRLPEILKKLNEHFPDYEFIHTSFGEFENSFKAENPKLQKITGPLYHIGQKGLNNIVLKNVLSSMAHLKQMNSACENLLTAWAEPFDFAASMIDSPRTDFYIRHSLPRSGFFKQAWKILLQNHPHDSICGCSISDVHEDNVNRFKQVLRIGERTTTDALEQIAENINTSSLPGETFFTVFNPAQNPTSGVTVFTLVLPKGNYKNFKLFDANGAEIPYQIFLVGGTYPVPVAPIHKLINFEEKEKVTVVASLSIPAGGYTTLSVKYYHYEMPKDGQYNSEKPDASRYGGTMRITRNSWDNGVLIVAFENGGLKVTDKKTGKIYQNLLTFEDCGDVGDGWNYVKPTGDSEFSTFGSCSGFAVLSDGPFAAVLELTHKLELPESYNPTDKTRACDRKTFELRTTVTILKGAETISFKTTVENDIEDHRLRVLFPTGFDSKEFYTQTPFDMQKWDVKKANNDKSGEIETNVNPTQGTVFIKDGKNAFALYTKGLYEVEVAESDRTVALTLFRAFPNEVAQPKATMGQMQTEMTFEYAAAFSSALTPENALQNSIAYKSGLRTFETGCHTGNLKSEQSFFALDSANSVVSALQLKPENCGVLRIFNPGEQTDKAVFSLAKPVVKAAETDFPGNVKSALTVKDGRVLLSLKPHEIKTVEFMF